MPPVYFWLILLLLAVKNKSAPIVLNNFPRLIKRITMPGKDESEYAQSGVSSFGAKTALGRILEHLLPTWKFNPRYPVIGGKEYYASVIDIGQGQGIAFCTDGVGTKIMIAEMLDKYDTIGIDCVAMNVNDIICVGARPASLVDYIACSFTDDKIFSDLAKGLAEGARQSEISISGGEISRIMLALKTVLAKVDAIPLLVFDEIDAGIGGDISSLIGKKLKDLTQNHQIICITHLHQIASFADQHFQVRKGEKNGRTRTEVEQLTQEERVAEIARMIAGDKITDLTIEHARQFLQGTAEA